MHWLPNRATRITISKGYQKTILLLRYNGNSGANWATHSGPNWASDSGVNWANFN